MRHTPRKKYIIGSRMYRDKYRAHKKRVRRQIMPLIVLLVAILIGATGGLVWRSLSHMSSASPQVPTSKNTLLKPGPIHAYGIAAGSSLTDLSPQELDARLSGIAASGATWIRFDFDWSHIQPDNANSFDWSTYDNLVAESRKYNLQVLGLITYTPAWARASNCSDSDKCRPADFGQFASFTAAVASRYKNSGLHYWEIWNEPNSPDFWKPGSNPVDYTALLKASFIAIRNQDADSYILTGGLSPQATTATSYTPKAFLNAIYLAGAKGYFDAVADHPYTFPLSPTNSADHAWNQMAATQSSLRQTMVANGESNKKIWITEFGAPTGGPGPVSTIANPNLKAQPYVVDETLQAKILTDAATLYQSYNWVGPFFWYSYQDAGTDPSTNENFFGLTRHNGTQKPAYIVFKQLAAASK